MKGYNYMNYISDLKKLAKIKEMAQGGDEGAKDFLFRFRDMDDEQTNAYLASIAVEEEPQIDQTNVNTAQEDYDWKSVVQGLIEDENEAIDGYDKAIKYITNANFVDEVVRTAYVEKLNHIKNEELEHIKELKEIL